MTRVGAAARKRGKACQTSCLVEQRRDRFSPRTKQHWGSEETIRQTPLDGILQPLNQQELPVRHADGIPLAFNL